MKASKLLIGIGMCVLVATGLGCSWWFGGQGSGLRLHGTVEIQEVRLGSKIGGRVAEVLVREGDLVEPSQVLVRFEAPELIAQRDQSMARVRSKSAALERAIHGARPEEIEAAQATALAARARYDRLQAGTRSEEIRQAEAELRREEATLALARREFNRSESLMSRKAVSTSDYDTTKAEWSRALARVEAARAHRELLVAGSRKEEIDEAAAELKRARANASLLEKGTRAEDVAQAEAALAEAQGRLQEVEAQLQESSILAPEQAVVEVLSVRKGDVVAPNQTVLRVLKADDLWVKVLCARNRAGTRASRASRWTSPSTATPASTSQGSSPRSPPKASSFRATFRAPKSAVIRCSPSRFAWPIPTGSSNREWRPRSTCRSNQRREEFTRTRHSQGKGNDHERGHADRSRAGLERLCRP